jgi:hypothetical protein
MNEVTIGQYTITRTDSGEIFIRHKSGESMQAKETALIAMLDQFWSDEF